MRAAGTIASLLWALALSASSAAAVPARFDGLGPKGPKLPPAPTVSPLRLDASPALSLLEPYRNARGRPLTALAAYRYGPFGTWIDRGWMAPDSTDAALIPRNWFAQAPGDGAFDASPSIVPPWLARLDTDWAQTLVSKAGCGIGGDCSLGSAFPAGAFAQLWTALGTDEPAVPWWVCRERPVFIGRHSGEHERMVVLHCDGSVPDGALETLSILARPPGVARPSELPFEPDPAARRGEWVPGIRMMHPRLLWVLHQIALSFPWRGIYIFSGYRVPEEHSGGEGHRSKHYEGRALDITVHGIPNDMLLKVCRKLEDVGCGYYPNNKFVHIDVRRRATGNALWIDTSGPGEPSQYVDSWPGVVDGGAFVWGQTR